MSDCGAWGHPARAVSGASYCYYYQEKALTQSVGGGAEEAALPVESRQTVPGLATFKQF